MKTEKIVLCSKNKAKQEAVSAFLGTYCNQPYDLICVESDSGVTATPMSDDEGIEGAINRIRNTREKISDADLYIGLEGIITENKFGTFVCGWAVIMSDEESLHFGCSSKVKLPDSIASQISSSKPLSEITAQQFPGKKHKLALWGTNGVVTDGLYTRVDEFTDALRCAFGTLEIE